MGILHKADKASIEEMEKNKDVEGLIDVLRDCRWYILDTLNCPTLLSSLSLVRGIQIFPSQDLSRKVAENRNLA